MAKRQIQIAKKSNEIIVSLPITMPTSKVRAKRPKTKEQSVPLATRKNEFRKDDYIEWQISYYTPEPQKLTTALPKKYTFNKPGGKKVFYPCELFKLAVGARSIGLWEKSDFKKIKNLTQIELSEGIQEVERISEKPTPNSQKNSPLLEDYEFHRRERAMPRYVKNGEKYFVEIQVSPRQQGLGHQAMIFLCLNIEHFEDSDGLSVLGRTAEVNEVLNYSIDKSNISLLTDVFFAFLFASSQHRKDIRLIFEKVFP